MRKLAARSFFVVAATLVASMLVRAAGAQEPSKQQCVTANESAQALRRSGKLRDARTQLLQCVNPACPGPVRDDCSERLNEVEKALPMIVFAAKDAGGADIASVRVTSDGAPFADRLLGAAVAVDPGQHVFAFEAHGYMRTERTILIREGDKERRISILLQPTPQTTVPPISQPTPAPMPAPPSTASTVQPFAPGGDSRTGGGESPVATPAPVAAYVALGVGGAGVVVTTIFGVLALGNKASLDNSCGSDKKACPSSSQSAINAMNTNSVISDVGLGVGIVGLGLGGVLLLVHGRGQSTSSSSDKTGAVHVEPWVGVGTLGMRGGF